MKFFQLRILILILSFSNQIFAQPENNHWVFATNSGIEFSSGSPTAVPGIVCIINEGGAAISDASGELLFYTNGLEVRNRDHLIMPNGTGLLMSDIIYGSTSSTSSTQGSVICKNPANLNQYYIFNIDPINFTTELVGGYLWASLVDMTLDDGNGDVLTTYKNVIIDSLVHEKMVLVQRNDCGAWLLVYSYMMQEYRAYPITVDGLGDPIISPSPYNSSGVGELCVSSDRTIILNPNYIDSKFELATFDANTGIVSNFNEYILPFGASPYGAEISPNGQLIYLNQNFSIVQYDITDYPAVTDVLPTAYTVTSSFILSHIRTGNDGKLYNFSSVASTALDCIHNPNEVGAACNFESAAVPISSSGALSLGSPTVPIDVFTSVVNNVMDTFICFNNSVILSTTESTSYLWDDGSTGMTRTVSESGTYWVKYGEACSQMMDTFHVTLIDTNLMLTNVDTIICGPNTITVSIEEREGYFYHWISGGEFADPYAASTTVSITESGDVTVGIYYDGCDTFYKSFFVEVKEVIPFDLGEDQTICLGKSIEILPEISTDDEDVTYNWSPSIGVSDPSAKDVVLSPEISTTYYLTVNFGAIGCNYTDSVRIHVISNEMTLVNNDTTICAGSTIVLNAIGHTSFNYYWTPETGVIDPHSSFTGVTPENSGYIHVRVSKLGCDDMYDSFYVNVEPVPTVNLGDDLVVCGGVPTQLYASVEPLYDGYTYSWSPGSRLNDSTIKDPIYTSYSVSDQLILTVNTPNECSTTDTIVITTIPKRDLEVNSNDTGFCYPGSVLLEAWNADSYVWTPSYGLSDDSISNPLATPDFTTLYQVIGNTEGCLDTQYVQVSVYPNATIYLDDTIIVYPGEGKEIDVVSNASYFEWFPPEGLSSDNIANPFASPLVRTRYFVTATTEHGCQILDSIDVVVDLDGVFEIPNAFVPGNNLSKNGIFKPIIHGEASIRNFQIWNRWGQVVFQSNERNEGWDGTMDGVPQPMGVYVYIVEVQLPNGNYIQRQGNVTLVR